MLDHFVWCFNVRYFFVDINLTDELGQTLMHDVAREWNVDVAKFLKFKGARIDKADNYGRTPLFVAVVSGHEEMIDWLLQNGGSIFWK